MPKQLFDVEEDDVAIKVNKSFAQRYQQKKKHEELSQLKDKYGQDALAGDEESSSETEDELAEGDTPDMEQDFLRTLSLLKANDPRLKDPQVTLFREKDPNEKPKKEKHKPMYLKDHERLRLMTKGVKAFVSDDEDEEGPTPSRDESYQSKQERLKKAFLTSTAELDEDAEAGDDEGDNLLKKRTLTDAEKEQRERDYQAWLEGEGKHLFDEEVEEDLQPLKRFWTDNNLSEQDKFLRDYITKRQWREDVAEGFEQPFGNEVDDSEDEEHVDEAEQYERQYNFRFEEDGSEQIKSYPRQIDTSVRRKDDRRQRERERQKERKLEEKKRKEEEIKRLKNLKQQEIMDKLKKVAEIGGADVDRLKKIDLEGDFDPETFDKQLQHVFDESFYEDDDEFDPEQAAQLPFDDSEYAEYDQHEQEQYAEQYDDQGGYGEDDFIMDADYDPSQLSKKERKRLEKEEKKRKKGKKGDVVSAASAALEKGSHTAVAGDEAPASVEEAKKTIAQKLDELYSLDYEDLIGDLPVRFKYRKVPQNDFGLSAAEILMADDKELNKWVSVKRMSQYRQEQDEKHDLRKFKKRGKNLRKKKQIFQSLQEYYDHLEAEKQAAKAPTETSELVGDQHAADTAEKPDKAAKRSKRKHRSDEEGDELGSKKRKKSKSDGKVKSHDTAPQKQLTADERKEKKKLKKKKKKLAKQAEQKGIKPSRLEAYKNV